MIDEAFGNIISADEANTNVVKTEERLKERLTKLENKFIIDLPGIINRKIVYESTCANKSVTLVTEKLYLDYLDDLECVTRTYTNNYLHRTIIENDRCNRYKQLYEDLIKKTVNSLKDKKYDVELTSTNGTTEYTIKW